MDEYNIYPKQFRSAKIPVEKNRCFVIMPFNNTFDGIYGNIKKELNAFGLVCNRADEISGSKPIMNKILTETLKSQYIIADITGYNPNVFYELGIAHTFKDSQNILLIKQKENRIPFDISHLTYIEYEPNNLLFLTSTIKRFIQENKYIANFHEALNVRGIISVIEDNKEIFVDYLQACLGDKLFAVIDLLNFNNKDYDEKGVEAILYDFQCIISKTITERNFELLPGVLRVYYALLVSCDNFSVSEAYISNFLTDYFVSFRLNEDDVLSWKTDMAIELASNKKKTNIVMPWLISYFSKSKSASIDLNRYKIERFFMTTRYHELNEVLISALFDKDCHIREHVADIIGAKQLFEAKESLFRQLILEENYFTAVSIIEAIGKLNDPNGIEYINNWISRNEKDIIETKQLFVLKHAYISISKLDISVDNKFERVFSAKYGELLRDY